MPSNACALPWTTSPTPSRVSYSGAPLHISIAKASEFPIFSDPAAFNRRRSKGSRAGEPAPNSGLSKTEGIEPQARAIIEDLQPYPRSKDDLARQLWPVREALADLGELVNIDKHRALHVITTAAGIRQYRGSDNPQGCSVEMRTGSLEPNTPLVRVRCPTAEAATHMKMDLEIAGAVTLNEATNWFVKVEPLPGSLRRIADHIADSVFPPLDGFL